ncbi:succinoglycan biosynthesis protein ExoP [Virgisporangium aliadipatigenens]|uniref:Succinoglycan biosynthesis protein ExoP n=2 Tax=Virgisporangium aliadipatigenens TaxID=741659 RepID=A0A8J3YFG5_9ACTN|nr:succinoglycan biosynthesis protein ExoP [Virgisporangium aliadipatigenens]
MISGVARGGVLNLAGAVVNQAALFGTMLLLARVLGAADVGRYAQCYAVLALLNLLALSGLRAGLTRFVAVDLADGDPGALRGTVHIGLSVCAGAAVLVGGALALAAPFLAAALHDDGLTTGLRLVALTLPASALGEAALAATRGWRTQRPSAFIGQGFEPLARLALTALALACGLGLAGAFWSLVVAAWAAAALSILALHRRVGTVEAAPPRPQLRRLFGFSTASWAASLATTGLLWLDTLLLGAFDDPDVGVYHVATRLVTLAVFVLAPVNAAFAPAIADLHHRGEFDGVRRLYKAATGWVVRLSVPAFVALLVLPGDLLALFGPAYPAGAAVTVILAAGQLVNAATGPCGTLLNMSGRVTLNLLDNAAALALNVVLNVWLIPAHGIVGAAVAWSASLVVVNVARVLQVRRLVGVLPVTPGLLKGLLAGAVSFAVALPLSPLPVLLRLVVIGAVYTAVVLGLRLSTEDKETLRAVLRRKAAA